MNTTDDLIAAELDDVADQFNRVVTPLDSPSTRLLHRIHDSLTAILMNQHVFTEKVFWLTYTAADGYWQAGAFTQTQDDAVESAYEHIREHGLYPAFLGDDDRDIEEYLNTALYTPSNWRPTAAISAQAVEAYELYLDGESSEVLIERIVLSGKSYA